MKKSLICLLLLVLLLPFGGCGQEEIPETPLRALTYRDSFAYDCIVPCRQEVYEAIDMDMQIYKEYIRADAEPTRTLELFDREWELRYETSRCAGLPNFDIDVYVSDLYSDMKVGYLTGTEQIFSISFSSKDVVECWKPADFMPNEVGFLAYAYNICAYYGIDTSDYIVEYDDSSSNKYVTFQKYLQGFETVYDVSFSFSEEGELSWFHLPRTDWEEVAINAKDLLLFTDENIINAVKHRIVPYLEDGVHLSSTEIDAKQFFLMDGELYMWVKMNFEYKKSIFYVDRKQNESSRGTFAADFVISVPRV